MNNSTTPAKSNLNFIFWLHLLLLVLTWTGPFLFPWQLMVLALGLVQVQFLIFGKCLMNEHHDLDESANPDATFYSDLFEMWGIPHNPAKVKFFIRNMMYPLLIVLILLLQVWWGYEPLIKFW